MTSSNWKIYLILSIMPLIPDVIQMNIMEAYHNWLANNPEKFEELFL